MYKLTSERKIPHYKSTGGKNVFFKRTEIEEWLMQNKIKTTAQLDLERNQAIKNLKNKK